MAGRSNIEWTEITWNPTIGCSKVSEGCKYCYAEKWARMQQKRGLQDYENGFRFQVMENRLNQPYTWKKSKVVFVNSMSDIFHEKISLEYLKKIFQVMNSTPQHIYQLLTKRTDRLKELYPYLEWGENIWMGVSVESNKYLGRIDVLRKIPAKIKFISFEPLLEKITFLNLNEIDWVIVGGESGGRARPIKTEWVNKIKESCEISLTPFFFKQWGKSVFNPDQSDPTIKKNHQYHSKGGCLINGEIFRELPKN